MAATSGAATATTSKTYEYDGRGQLTSIADFVAGTTVLEYDNQGNLVSKTLGSNLTSYAYNARDNLISFASNGTLLGKYGNDFRGLRVEKEAKNPLFPDAAPVRLRTLWDGSHAFLDTNTSGAVVTRYESDGRHPVGMWSAEDGSHTLHRTGGPTTPAVGGGYGRLVSVGTTLIVSVNVK